jgi:ABC-type branched-subunit amino acid transport system substrate-binding protein
VVTLRARALIAVGATALALAAAGCARTDVTPVVIIGAHLPLSGPDATVGGAMARGYRRAVEAVNSEGGLRLGRPARRVLVKLDLRDDGGDPAAVDGLVGALVEAGCHALLGTASDVRTAMQASVADRLGVPLLVSAFDAPGLPGSRQHWVFSVDVAGNEEERAYLTARSLLEAIDTARAVDPVALRNALARR